jgi:hypothetical protein
MKSEFEDRLRNMQHSKHLQPTIDVADTMETFRIFFLEHDVVFTASDLLEAPAWCCQEKML